MSPSSTKSSVRDIFWQAVVLVGSLGLLTFFVINASRNMRDAGIASGFDFLWRTAGIEIPFVLTNYTAQSNNLALLWVGIVNTMLITLVVGRRRDRARLPDRHRAALAQLAARRRSRAPTSRPCATSRCCSSCCSGTSA